MKLTLLPIFILTSLFIFSCAKTPNEFSHGYAPNIPHITLSTEEWMSIAYDNPKEVSEESVLNIINSFISQKYVGHYNITRQVKDISSLKLLSRYGLADKISFMKLKSGEVSAYNIDCPISEYEFHSGGEKYKIIVSTDERYPKVLALMKINAISDTQSYCNDNDISNQDDSLNLLNLSYEVLFNHLYKIEVAKELLKEKTLHKICKELNRPIQNISFEEIKNIIHISDLDKQPTTRGNSIQMPTDQIIAGCWPLVDVTWGTDSPVWRTYMPYFYNTERVYPPRIFEAILHILSFIQPKITIPAKNYEEHGYKPSMVVDWAYLTEKPVLGIYDPERKKEMAARLVRLLSDESGVVYRSGRENIYWAENINMETVYKLLKKYIECDTPESYDLSAIINSLSNLRPVFVFNDFFAWIFDGFLKTRSTAGVNSTYLHIRLGNYHGSINSSTGYYLVNADSSLAIQFENSSNYRYSKDMDIITDCRL